MIVMYGRSGQGKTSTAAQFLKPIFLMARGEDGLITLANAGQIADTPFVPGQTGDTINSYFELTSTLDALIRETHDYRTVVLDAWVGFETLAQQHVCETQFGGDWGEHGYASYGKGDRAFVREIENLFARYLKILVTHKKMTVVILAHTVVKTFQNPEGPNYDQYVGSPNDKIWPIVTRNADEIWFMHTPVGTKKADKADKKAIGTSDGSRCIYTQAQPAFEAKTRLGLPACIDLGKSPQEAYAAIRAALNGKGE